MTLELSWPRPDHPRGCGEHAMKGGKVTFSQGSSPRMRGALLKTWLSLLMLGIIPADAGSTAFYTATPIPSTDHPRGCGEHVDRQDVDRGIRGSSPRMRGAPPWARRWPRGTGIIPADAGSTGPQGPAGPPIGDHPRGCGEHGPWRTSWRPDEGSSPRMRGALLLDPDDHDPTGIIPADAGSTFFRASFNFI